jgi:hypothetical protein
MRSDLGGGAWTPGSVAFVEVRDEELPAKIENLRESQFAARDVGLVQVSSQGRRVVEARRASILCLSVNA